MRPLVNVLCALAAVGLSACPNARRVPSSEAPAPDRPAAIEQPAAPPDTSTLYYEHQVERAAIPRRSCQVAPQYPDDLRSAGITGRVEVWLVVGRDGRPEMSTFRATRSTNTQFTNAVRAALSKWCFEPAMVAGRPVRQVVQVPFNFDIQ